MFDRIETCKIVKRTTTTLAVPISQHMAEEIGIKTGMPVDIFQDKDTIIFVLSKNNNAEKMSDIFSSISGKKDLPEIEEKEQQEEEIKTIEPARQEIPKTWPTGITVIDENSLKLLTDAQKQKLVGWDGKDDTMPAGFMWCDADLIYSDPE